ncbi:hypothetical protein [Marinicrinis sediminis]|uniref:Uncharacterized protein n=1 Tax=Marinicrinis sediminis TaxID=1652465 RepID=A0ABW5R743_9BACL
MKLNQNPSSSSTYYRTNASNTASSSSVVRFTNPSTTYTNSGTLSSSLTPSSSSTYASSSSNSLSSSTVVRFTSASTTYTSSGTLSSSRTPSSSSTYHGTYISQPKSTVASASTASSSEFNDKNYRMLLDAFQRKEGTNFGTYELINLAHHHEEYAIKFLNYAVNQAYHPDTFAFMQPWERGEGGNRLQDKIAEIKALSVTQRKANWTADFANGFKNGFTESITDLKDVAVQFYNDPVGTIEAGAKYVIVNLKNEVEKFIDSPGKYFVDKWDNVADAYNHFNSLNENEKANFIGKLIGGNVVNAAVGAGISGATSKVVVRVIQHIDEKRAIRSVESYMKEEIKLQKITEDAKDGQLVDEIGLSIDKVMKREKTAIKFYDTFRLLNNDIDNISENTGINKEAITRIKNHIFFESHLHNNGSVKRFDPDYEMAMAWERLINNEYLEKDILLLHHELFESTYMKLNGATYEQAHRASEEYFRWNESVYKIPSNYKDEFPNIHGDKTTREQATQNLERLKTDHAYRLEEMERAESVIMHQGLIGEDTSSAKNYLNKLKDIDQSYTRGYGSTTTVEKAKDNMTKLYADNEYRNSEIIRTQEVIQYRKQYGLDVSAQETWLEKLYNIQSQTNDNRTTSNNTSKSSNSSTNSSSNTNSSGGRSSTETQSTPSLGYGSKGVSTQEAQKHMEKINNDSSFRNSEIERAEKVIEERKKQGLDVSEQVAYLNKIS